jgi:UDP-N-acetyl-2-amino-2-deoxyglucuronate dehydrogenase
MQELSPLKFAVQGAGHIGLRHIQILMGLPEAQLMAVIEPAAAARSRLAQIFPGPCFPTLAAYVGSSGDAAVLSVCTPNHLHVAQARAALAAGMHVLCEKPLALQAAEAAHLLGAAHQAGKALYCMQQLALGPVLPWLKQQLGGRQLGAIRHVAVEAHWCRDEKYYAAGGWRGKLATDGGPLFTQFSHFIHALHWLFGDLEISGAQFQNRRQPPLTEFEDSGQFRFRLQAGGTGTMSYTTAAAPDQVRSEIRVVTDMGSFCISGQYLQELSHLTVPGLQPPVPAALSPAALQERFFKNLIRQLQGGTTDYSSAREGLQVVATIEKVYASRFPPG